MNSAPRDVEHRRETLTWLYYRSKFILGEPVCPHCADWALPGSEATLSCLDHRADLSRSTYRARRHFLDLSPCGTSATEEDPTSFGWSTHQETARSLPEVSAILIIPPAKFGRSTVKKWGLDFWKCTSAHFRSLWPLLITLKVTERFPGAS